MRKEIETAIAALTSLLDHVDALAEFSTLQDAIAHRNQILDQQDAKLAAGNAKLEAIRAEHSDLTASFNALRAQTQSWRLAV